jgi:large conductance mechanosensitive channel
MKLIKEFKEFLDEYKIIGLAVAFIIGVAATALVTSLVNNVVMPVVTPFIPGGAWQNATVTIPTGVSSAMVIGWGAFAGSLINFIIIALVVFIIAKAVLKEEKVGKK